MSDRMMTVAEAREWVAQDKSTRPTPRAARMIVAQAEQIERLQEALRAADGLVLSFSGLPPRTDFEGGYNLHSGDMDAEE